MNTFRVRPARTGRLGFALAVALLASMFAPLLAQADTDLEVGGKAVVAYSDGDSVRLRSGPGPTRSVVTQLAEGTPVDVLDGPVSGDDGPSWFKVSARGSTGYMSADYLANSDHLYATTSGIAVATSTVNVRSGPSMADRIVTVLGEGEQATLTGENRAGWLSVSTPGGNGYVYGAFLKAGSSSSATGSSASAVRYTIDTVHLRSGPSTSNGSLKYMPVGVKLTLTGAQENGFARVSTTYGTGWVYAQYIGKTAPATETGFTNDVVRLRSGADSSYRTISTLPVGTKLQLTGDTQNGYSKVGSSHGAGWVASAYISSLAPQYTGGTRYTTDAVNLRRGSSTGSSVLKVVPSRTTIQFTGTVVNGFGKVATTYGDGWISIDYFTKTKPSAPAGSLVAWPVKGGEWRVSQGYNGSSHQNETKYWQYYYSFDIKRTSGSTAGQAVYAPVSGRIRWIDESTGGMSIYMGDGLAFAMFHVHWAGSIREGQTITQGQYLGVIAPAGQANNGGSPHLHITGWTTNDEGNWSRKAQPFVGRFAIEGASFPATGSRDDYWGYTFNP